MNYDDQFNKDFEEKFQKNLAAIRKMEPNTIKFLEENLVNVKNVIDDFNKKPNKSPEDLIFLGECNLRIQDILQNIQDIQLILNESLVRKARAYYENVKKLAKEGNREAERIYNDLKNDFERFDVN